MSGRVLFGWMRGKKSPKFTAVSIAQFLKFASVKLGKDNPRQTFKISPEKVIYPLHWRCGLVYSHQHARWSGVRVSAKRAFSRGRDAFGGLTTLVAGAGVGFDTAGRQGVWPVSRLGESGLGEGRTRVADSGGGKSDNLEWFG